MSQLDIHGIIDRCCGVSNPKLHTYTRKKELLAKQFVAAGCKPISADSIQKWLERRQIPGDRVVDLLRVAQHQGKRLNLDKFLKTGKQKAQVIFG